MQWWSNVLHIVVCSWPQFALACFEFDLFDVGREGKETEIEGSSSCLDCRRGWCKHIFYTWWKARAMNRLFHQGQSEEVCKGEFDGPEEVAAPLRDEGTASENNTMHLECVVSWRANDELGDPREGGLDQAVDLCGNWVTCPSHHFNCNLRCFCSSSSRSISLASTMLGCMCRSLAMFLAGCRHLRVDAMFGYHGRRKKAQSFVRMISSNQRNPRNPKLAKSMKSGLIERAQ